MGDTYQSFGELLRGESEGRDWSRTYEPRGSTVLIMAPHGGWIEPFTSELAQEIAGESFSFYTFQGLKESGNQALHITSHRFDEPLALAAAEEAQLVVAIHGERSAARDFVMIGGRDEALREAVAGRLEEDGFSVEPPRRGLGGRNPGNICNRGQAGAGIQLELSEGLRRRLRTSPDERSRFVEGVRSVLLDRSGEDGRE